MLKKLSVRELDLEGKRVFLREDFNVPLDKGRVADDTRLREALPTIKYLIERKAVLILASHLGRPRGHAKPELSLRPVAERLEQLLERRVFFLADCIGTTVRATVLNGKPGDVFMLENLRFYPEEERNDEKFAAQLAELADVYVNDAFGTAHRAHASTVAVARLLKVAAAGLLMEKEIEQLDKLLSSPARPFAALLGGAKVSDKIEVIENLIGLVDVLAIGGGMAYTFLKAQGREVGSSLVEEEKVELVRRLIDQANRRGVKLLLPIDHVASRSPKEPVDVMTVEGNIPAGWMGVDIGPQAIALFSQEIAGAHTVFWNGPLGIFEIEAFSRGTLEIARALASVEGVTVAGGGDTIAALRQAGVYDKITHVSTGGGASLEFLAGKKLPGIEALTDKL